MIRYFAVFVASLALCSPLTVYSQSIPETITIEFSPGNRLDYGFIESIYYYPTKDSDGFHLCFEEIKHIPPEYTVIDTFFICVQSLQESYVNRDVDDNDQWYVQSDGTPLYSETYVDCIILACAIKDNEKGECVIIDTNNDEDLSNDPVLSYSSITCTVVGKERKFECVDTEATAEYYDGARTRTVTMPLRFYKKTPLFDRTYNYRFNLMQIGETSIDGDTYLVGWPLFHSVETNRDWNYDKWSAFDIWVDLNRDGTFDWDDYYNPMTEPFTIFASTYQGIEFDRFGRNLVLEKLDTDEFPPIAVGLAAPVFSAETLDGETFDLAKQNGKYVLLDFWGSWCSPCMGDIPYLKEAHERFGDMMQFVGIAVDDDRHGLEQCIAEHGIEWTQIHKTSQDPLPELYQIEGYPSLFLIGPDGTLVDKTYLRREHLIPTLEKHIR